ncbi:MAG: DUF7948 domain-containing protein [Bacteroidia bacterium]
MPGALIPIAFSSKAKTFLPTTCIKEKKSYSIHESYYPSHLLLILNREVTLQNIYQGIDLRYYSDQGRLRFDYIVHPGADPSQITFTFHGTPSVYTTPEGNLVFATRFR